MGLWLAPMTGRSFDFRFRKTLDCVIRYRTVQYLAQTVANMWSSSSVGRWWQEITKQHPELCCEEHYENVKSNTFPSSGQCFSFDLHRWLFVPAFLFANKLKRNRSIHGWQFLGTCSSWDTEGPQVQVWAALPGRLVPAFEKSPLRQWGEWLSWIPAQKHNISEKKKMMFDRRKISTLLKTAENENAMEITSW